MKHLFKSKTIWGVLVTVAAPYLPTALQAAGIENPTEVVQAAMTVIGAATAVYGRIKATKPLRV